MSANTKPGLDPVALRRIARWACRCAGLEEGNEEDLAQELYVIAYSRLGHYNPARAALETYLAGWAWRIAQNWRRQQVRQVFPSSLNLSDTAAEDTDDDQWAALGLYETPDPLPQPELVWSVVGVPQEALTAALANLPRLPRRTPRPAQVPGEHLKQLRHTLGMTRRQLADLLGCQEYQITKYENGTQPLPLAVWQRAQTVVTQQALRAQLAQHWVQRPLADLARQWIGEETTVAQTLGISVKTLRRWQSDQRPPGRKLNRVLDVHLRWLALQSVCSPTIR